MNIDISIANKNLSIVKDYVGEPVSKGRRLTVTQNCSGKKTELFNEKYCDFSNFKLTDKNLFFTAKFYNPDTGECTSPKTKDFNLKVDDSCK